MSVERTRGCIVAYNPVLVVDRHRIYRDGISQSDAIRGPTHQNLFGQGIPACVFLHGNGGDNPLAVCRVVSDGRITRSIEGACLKSGDSARETNHPNNAAFDGCSEADIGRYAAKEASKLKR